MCRLKLWAIKLNTRSKKREQQLVPSTEFVGGLWHDAGTALKALVEIFPAKLNDGVKRKYSCKL